MVDAAVFRTNCIYILFKIEKETREVSLETKNIPATTSVTKCSGFRARIIAEEKVLESLKDYKKGASSFVKEKSFDLLLVNSFSYDQIFGVKRPLNPIRKRKDIYNSQISSDSLKISLQIRRAFNVPVRKIDAKIKPNLPNASIQIDRVFV